MELCSTKVSAVIPGFGPEPQAQSFICTQNELHFKFLWFLDSSCVGALECLAAV